MIAFEGERDDKDTDNEVIGTAAMFEGFEVGCEVGMKVGFFVGD